MVAAAAAAAAAATLICQPQLRRQNAIPTARPLSLPSPVPHLLTPNSASLRRLSVVAATPAKAAATPVDGVAEKPRIELVFIDPKVGVDGEYGRLMATAASGEKLLRDVMLDNKIELYAPYGKVMNCGGGGSCGTCIVEVVDGQDLLNERTNTEERYLKKKPETWRLACQTIVGNKENSGKVVVQRLPQWKK